MQNENFQQWLSQATELTIYQKKQAFSALSDETQQALTEE